MTRAGLVVALACVCVCVCVCESEPTHAVTVNLALHEHTVHWERSDAPRCSFCALLALSRLLIFETRSAPRLHDAPTNGSFRSIASMVEW